MSKVANVLAGAVLLCLGIGGASQSVASDSAVSLGLGYALEPAGWFPDFQAVPPDGGHLFVAGTVAAFGSPFEDLHPGSDPEEYTYAMYVPCWSGGVWDDFENGKSGWWTRFGSGWLRVCRDPAANSAPGEAQGYEDGELILEFRVDDLDLWGEWCTRSGVETANLTLTGGALLPRVSPGGAPVDADATGQDVSAQLCGPPQTCAVAWPGQIGCAQSEVFLGPVPTRPTGSHLKNLLRV